MGESSSASLWIALTSVGISCISLGWNIVRDVVDRGTLRVKCAVTHIKGPGWDENRDYVSWTVTNTGRRPIVVGKIGGNYPSGMSFAVAPHERMPRTLQPGEALVEYTESVDVGRTIALCAWDTLNHVYRAPKQDLRAIKRDFQKGTGPRFTIVLMNFPK